MVTDRKPVYLLAGGPSSVRPGSPDPLIRAALDQAGCADPSVAYIGAASNDNAGFRTMITRLLREAGAKDVQLVPLCGRGADPKKAMQVIESCQIAFISGGDVELGMRVLKKAGMVDFLRDQYQKGKPFFGVSAGSIMLGKAWVRWRDPDDLSTYELFPCLGLTDVLCDTHDEEDGWEELRILAQLIPSGTMVFGIPSGSALIANPDGSVQAIGGEVHRFMRTGDGVSPMQSIRDSRFKIQD
jgi:peptidase E